MGPVSFSRFSFSNRTELLEAARRLSAEGIRVQSVGDDTGLLVRADDKSRADDVLSRLTGAGDEIVGDDPSRQAEQAVAPLLKPFDTTVNIPGSKSHTNRALLCAALAAGSSKLANVLLADDTHAMLGAVSTLGATVAIDRTSPVSANVVIEGFAGLPGEPGFGAPGSGDSEAVAVDVRQSGTTSRFLLPTLAAIEGGRFRLDGDEQLRIRPFGPQIEALRGLGAEIDGQTLPLDITGQRLTGGKTSVSGDISSQFLSGLLLAAPMFSTPTSIQVDGHLVSQPYVELTLTTMALFGVEVEADFDQGIFVVPADGSPDATAAGGRAPYRCANVDIEPDASAASYFFAAAAMTGSTARVEGLGLSTIQGDLGFVHVLEQMGAKVTVAEQYTEVTGTGRLSGVTVDMADISDTVQTLAAVAACADSPTEITGVGFIRHKETDRIAAPVAELQRLGVGAEATADGLVIKPAPIRSATVQTYDDHRMAMSFALLGLCHPGIVIADPDCVNKTFPNFFAVLQSLSNG